MEKKSKRLPSGLFELRLFYLLNFVFSDLTMLLFYKSIGVMVWKYLLTPIFGGLVKCLLVFLPLYMFLDLKPLKPRIYYLILYYHIFFIINSILALLHVWTKSGSVLPLLRLVAKKETLDATFGIEYTVKYATVHGAGLAIGIVIILFIWRIRGLFLTRSQ